MDPGFFWLFLLTLFLFQVVDEMEEQCEQRTVLKFLVKSSAMPMESWNKLHTVFRDRTMTPKTVRCWSHHFQAGDENVKDLPRSGRPRSACTGLNIQKVQDAIAADRRSSIQEVYQLTELKPTSVHMILKKDLRLSKLAPKFVPWILTQEQKQFRMQLCKINLASLREDSSFLSRIITGDESWISVFEVELKKKTQGSGTPRVRLQDQ